ncbi:hypothetical protein [Aliivibrio fischeri]|uniref:hypothetical protein n=1 Tax=Aliivibrio fischeri TaxID=668 RepID=UPI0012D8CD29|nr:hypothetical protein [Aliivibrio fischeri]MUJ20367.1 hypothetical protein [Aliivibrio fischeri]
MTQLLDQGQEHILIVSDEYEMDYAALPVNIATTIFDSLFLSGNRVTKDVATRLSQKTNGVADAISGGALYGNKITKPWWNAGDKPVNARPFHSIQAEVFGSVVNTTDRHLLDSIIAVGKHLPSSFMRQATLEEILQYWLVAETKKGNKVNYEYEHLSVSAKMNFKKNVSSDLYYYYIVGIEPLFTMLDIGLGKQNRLRLKNRIDRLGLSEFRVKFLDENDNDIRPGQAAKFKLLEPSYYTFVNTESIRNRSQLNEDSFTHLIVGVGSAYIKSLKNDSTINRKKFIKHYVGITNKANVLDFFKTLNTHQANFLVGKSLKKQIKHYYEQKAESGSLYITTKINKTFNEIIQPLNIRKMEECFGLSLKITNDKSGNPSDATFFRSRLCDSE